MIVPNPAPVCVGSHACTKPDDALTTVGLDDRLNTVESVTGIVPPDVATITKGALESVTVPDVIVVAVLTTVQLLLGETMPLLRLVGLLSTTVGLLDSVTVPLDSDRIRFVTVTAVLMLVTVTAVDGLVTVTAVDGLLTATRRPPELVRGP